MERREVGQFESFMKDKRRLNATVSQKQPIRELRQGIAMSGHGLCSRASLVDG
jgi:hypothetical protein